MSCLYLFADTNVFIQCRHLEDLDWEEWSSFTDVKLIASRPVQREIDKQKYRGNDRVGRRARKTYSRFREVITSNSDQYLLRESDPTVALVLLGPYNLPLELAEKLDFSNPDDCVVACMYEYSKQHGNRDVRLITHDAGQMMTAKSLELQFIPIPDDWLLKPEKSKEQKELDRLREQMAQFRRGPEFEINFVGGCRGSNALAEIRAEQHTFEPLGASELVDLMNRLDVRAKSKTGLWSLRVGEDYDSWLKECKRLLATLHESMQLESPGVEFRLTAKNIGKSSARDVLVKFSAKGGLHLMPSRESYGDFFDEIVKRTEWLPAPPLTTDFLRTGLFESAQDHGPGPRRDPNDFYFKRGLPEQPVESFSLECEHWRHEQSEFVFDGEIYVVGVDATTTGAVICEVHADNLIEPKRTVIPVRLEVEVSSVAARAKELIDRVGGHG